MILKILIILPIIAPNRYLVSCIGNNHQPQIKWYLSGSVKKKNIIDTAHIRHPILFYQET